MDRGQGCDQAGKRANTQTGEGSCVGSSGNTRKNSTWARSWSAVTQVAAAGGDAAGVRKSGSHPPAHTQAGSRGQSWRGAQASSLPPSAHNLGGAKSVGSAVDATVPTAVPSIQPELWGPQDPGGMRRTGSTAGPGRSRSPEEVSLGSTLISTGPSPPRLLLLVLES